MNIQMQVHIASCELHCVFALNCVLMLNTHGVDTHGNLIAHAFFTHVKLLVACNSGMLGGKSCCASKLAPSVSDFLL